MKITKKTHPTEIDLMIRAFPGYRGRTYRLTGPAETVCATDTYWDGGSRAQYVFVRVADRACLALPDFISGGFLPSSSRALDAFARIPVPTGYAVVRHSIFCGRDVGLTLTYGTGTSALVTIPTPQTVRDLAPIDCA